MPMPFRRATVPPPPADASGEGTSEGSNVDVVDLIGDTDLASDNPVEDDDAVGAEPTARWWRRTSSPRWALIFGIAAAAALAGVIGLLGVQVHQNHQSAQVRALFLQVGRQGAVNLTTIDWNHADDDVQRILSAATGSFYDDFSARSQPFVDVVKEVQSTSTGTITAAGLQSSTDTSAQVLVAVGVRTSTKEAPQQTPRSWRMLITVQRVGPDVKVSNVEFVP